MRGRRPGPLDEGDGPVRALLLGRRAGRRKRIHSPLHMTARGNRGCPLNQTPRTASFDRTRQNLAAQNFASGKVIYGISDSYAAIRSHPNLRYNFATHKKLD